MTILAILFALFFLSVMIGGEMGALMFFLVLGSPFIVLYETCSSLLSSRLTLQRDKQRGF